MSPPLLVLALSSIKFNKLASFVISDFIKLSFNLIPSSYDLARAVSVTGTPIDSGDKSIFAR